MGQIMQVGFSFAPLGWALAQGAVMGISQNAALFTLLGANFGGDGQQTFGLPDTRGRLMLGVGAGPGLEPVGWGEKAGNATVTILQSNMPPHVHPATFAGQQGTTTASGALQAVQVPPGNAAQEVTSPVSGACLGTLYDTSGNGSTITPQGTVSIGPTGGAIPTEILNPYIGVYTLIATQGIFPSRG